MHPERIKELAHECGFELAGIAAAAPAGEAKYYREWAASGMAGEMRYLTDRRAALRDDPRSLLPSARSILCVGKLYNGPQPYSTRFGGDDRAWISRYAWGQDYHDVLRRGLAAIVERLRAEASAPFDWKICVDTAPLLERAYARHAGLGWIGKNSCLINQAMGSWFFLGEVLLSLDLAPDRPPPDRCGTCTRCIDACPTEAIVPTRRAEGPAWALDARLCISYFTIELRGPAPEAPRAGIGRHVFGCDICQDVCPWNRRAPVSREPGFAAAHFAPPLEQLAGLSEDEFRQMFRGTPIPRARYAGFLRNVALAMGNSKQEKFRAPLERLAASEEPVVSEAAGWGLAQLSGSTAALP
ncbi:MAG TPA: tRNA epoxyqueuosine(34) reductase QueG [Bryobacteraceae bacterium]|nr:tRNA epoxyqueuosine(34) reductase QueG [Bryobacteraceae bacterium]